MPALTVKIASGDSVSGTPDLDGVELEAVVVPAAWTAADLTFQVSVDRTTWSDLLNSTGTEIKITAGPGKAHLNPFPDSGMRFMRFRSGTAATPVAQAAERTVTAIVTAPN